jgi:hypothetical protein
MVAATFQAIAISPAAYYGAERPEPTMSLLRPQGVADGLDPELVAGCRRRTGRSAMWAVELRCEETGGTPEDLVGAFQVPVLRLEGLDPPGLTPSSISACLTQDRGDEGGGAGPGACRLI